MARRLINCLVSTSLGLFLVICSCPLYLGCASRVKPLSIPRPPLLSDLLSHASNHQHRTHWISIARKEPPEPTGLGEVRTNHSIEESSDELVASKSLESMDLNNSTSFRLEQIDRPFDEPAPRSASVMERLASDQWRFYSPESLIPLGVAFGIGGAIANTQLDDQIQHHFRSSVLNATSDEWLEKLHGSKELGNGYYSLPVYGAMWLANEWIDGPPAFEATGTWGERSMRGFLAGAPMIVVGQVLTGGSRPSDSLGSHWDSFDDNNGVSGHAFMSALPFITGAKMTKNPWLKTAWYAGSTIGPLSRMNDNAHYPSQVGLGWCIAYLSASAIDPNSTRNGWTLKPMATTTGSGLAAEFRW